MRLRETIDTHSLMAEGRVMKNTSKTHRIEMKAHSNFAVTWILDFV